MKRLTLDIETYNFAFIIAAKDEVGNFHTYVATDFVDVGIVRQFMKMLPNYDWIVTYNGTAFDLRVLSWIASIENPWIPVSKIAEEASRLVEDLNRSRNKSKGKGKGFVTTSACWRCNTDLYYKIREKHFDVYKAYTVDKDKGLKQWELYRGWSVKETSVDFKATTCTKEELDDCVEYCKHDVEATEALFLEKSCQELIEARSWVLQNCEGTVYPDLAPADLADKYLYGFVNNAEIKSVDDYIDWNAFKVPSAIKNGLQKIAHREWYSFLFKDGKVTKIFLDKEMKEEYKRKCPKEFVTSICYGAGGCHYAKQGLNENVWIFDVASLYPHIIVYHTGLKTEEATLKFKTTLERRLGMKSLKGTDQYSKAIDLGLKLMLNSPTGKFRQEGALAYAPNCGLAMCIIGQLAITEAAFNAIEDRWEDLVEINTDSFAVVGDISRERAKLYCSKVQHHFTFEADHFPKSYWCNVNNYVVFNDDGTYKETHGQDSSDLIKKKNEPIVVRSLFDNVLLPENSVPVLNESDVFEDYIVKYSKAANSKNATIDGVPMSGKHYYFLWVTEDCKDGHAIEFSSDRIDKAHGLIKSRYGVYAFNPKDLEPYFKYVDREQYLVDLKQLLVVWNREDLCNEFAYKLKRAKVVARNKAIKECKTFGDIKKQMENFYSDVTFRI